MPLAEEIEQLYQEFTELFKKYKEQEKLGDGFEKVAKRMGKGFSRGTLYRIFFPETHGKQQKAETRRDSLKAAINRLKELMGSVARPMSNDSPTIPPLGKQASPQGPYHEFVIYYWDWSTPADSDAGLDTGSVVTGRLRLPINWKGKGAKLWLHDGSEAIGKIWVQVYKPGKFHLSARFVRAGAPDLFLTLNIANENQISLLLGAFATADVERHSPLHGTVYLRHQPAPSKTSDDAYEPSDEDATDLMIKQALFQQTYVQKDRQPLPNFVKGSYKTLTDTLLGKTFRGYFIHTQDETLESFKLRVHNDGRITIVYRNGKTEVGQFRSYHEKVLWFAFDYDIKWGLHRYRMLFWKHTEPGWYLGVGSGSETMGNQIFMNRVAMFETNETWDLGTIKVEDPIPFNVDNQARLTSLFSEYTVLREYLSGEDSPTILNNQRLSETAYILKKAGLLREDLPGILPDTQVRPTDLKSLSGAYCLYALAREPTPNGKDEWFEIVEMPLTIHTNGKLEMIGHEKKYFGQAHRDGERLMLQFTERLLDGADHSESTFMTYCLRLHDNDGKFIGHSQGTMVRFVSAMPEARTVMLVAGKQSDDIPTYKSYRIFSPEWVALRASERGYLTRLFAGRINRIIALNGDGKKLPENRQPEFRELYADAALAYHNSANHKAFIDYFHKAALHNYGEEESESASFITLRNSFYSLYAANYARWHKITKRKADELKIYLQLISSE
ncbi:hypothetical protein F5984_26210 [Rudanella paleaurantiibacter]|uniref:Uncharacterized protein n=1 Tax=Rudanella paleaurantiibacter TaxID=2614655 RepID=A0A7J5TRU7_9BACT|nr:hypothetical protein [Rudanella paleaurantiibacter]KAB7725377.1 hypothetical protein F5984_26210 [Rudanella paleaurantiibacter]